MKKTFYSNGKLLLTGEYIVLNGSKALAVPTRYGQYLHLTANNSEQLHWKSLDADGTVWYEDSLSLNDIRNNTYTEDNSTTATLIKILHQAHTQNPNLLNNTTGIEVRTELTFPRQWGLGTSSTLINNIAQWFCIDAYQLLWSSFGGSGYDIACAMHNTPVIYQIVDGKPAVKKVHFKPVFEKNLFFVYLNQKQNSREAIAAYRERQATITATVSQINKLTAGAIETNTINDFKELLHEHETIMSKVLGILPVKERLFPDFTGVVKSLGAWGGDFVLAVSEKNPETYFKEKGYDIIIPYSQMVLK